MRKELAFWLSVMLVAVFGVAAFKVIGVRVGGAFPPLAKLANFI